LGPEIRRSAAPKVNMSGNERPVRIPYWPCGTVVRQRAVGLLVTAVTGEKAAWFKDSEGNLLGIGQALR
jgi:hypothetical protein